MTTAASYRVTWRRVPYQLEFDFMVRALEECRWMEGYATVVMRWGGEGLARRLGVRLLAAG